MTLHALFCISLWSDFFDVSEPPLTFNNKKENERLSENILVSDKKAYVYSCLFIDAKSLSDGGAIGTESVDYFMVESTTFISCETSSKYGGAVYYYNYYGGRSVLSKICSQSCYTSFLSYNDRSVGQFCYIVVQGETSNRNNFDDSSVDKSMPDVESHSTICLNQAAITIKRDNVTNNTPSFRSAFNAWQGTSVKVSFSSFTDNKASTSNCFYITSYTTILIESCNVIENMAQNSILISNDKTIEAENTCFFRNTCNSIFLGNVQLTSCALDNTENIPIGAFVNHVDLFTNNLYFINTQACPARTKKTRCGYDLRRCGFYNYQAIPHYRAMLNIF